MILEMKYFFNQIYSIELDKNLYLRAKKKFDNTTNIYILQGDSCMVLPDLLNKIEKKCEQFRLLQKGNFYPEDVSGGTASSKDATRQ